MISIEDCMAYLSECQALAAEAKLSLRRATAVMAVCHAWLALRDAIFTYEAIAAEEEAARQPAKLGRGRFVPRDQMFRRNRIREV
jgi:hypothetical protein